MAEIDQPDAPPAGLITAENGATGQAGTGLAIIDTIPSCGLIPAKRGWGGARNRADRVSSHLTLRQCQELIAAAGHAEKLGLRFNRHWTVHYERAGIASIDAPAFITRLLKLVREYCTRKKGKFTAVWVREDGEGKGGHVHILMHIPAACDLRGRCRYWVRLAGGTYRKKVSRVRSIGGRLEAATRGSEQYQHNLGKVLGYILKGASATVGQALALPRHGDSGLVVGKRCGWTQNIGKSERCRKKEREYDATSNAERGQRLCAHSVCLGDW